MPFPAIFKWIKSSLGPIRKLFLGVFFLPARLVKKHTKKYNRFMPFISLPLPDTFSPCRVVVGGTTGSGKTSMAAAVACILNVPHVELDALNWLPGWKESPLDEFRARVAQALSGPAWVVDGNYSRQVRHLTWGKAEALVWLDYSLPVIWWRLLRRTVRRTLSRELLWGTNRETWRGTFLAKDSLFLFAITSSRRHRQEFPLALARPEYAHLCAIRLRTPREGEQFLAQLKARQG
jgi:adenylate kinase family enzyme